MDIDPSEEKDLRQYLKKKKTFRYQLDENLVLVKAGTKSTIIHQIQNNAQGIKKPCNIN